jgi:hypothetical protein
MGNLKCSGCERTWGLGAFPEERNVCETTRFSPIKSIREHLGGGLYIYEYDHGNESEYDGDIIESSFTCSYCGETIDPQLIPEIVKSYAG